MRDLSLPTDVLVEVLIRLPVKSIVKFRCVSKTWRGLIMSPMFVQRHQKRGRKQRVLLVKRYLPPQTEVLFFSNLRLPIFNDWEISSYGNFHMVSRMLPQQNEEVEIFSFHDPELFVSPDLSIQIQNDLNIPWHRHCHSNIPIHGPCNGFVCIAFERTVFLCNPALREFKLLPPLRFPFGCIAIPLQDGFGFELTTGDYKVIRITNVSHMARVVREAGFSIVFGESKLRFDLYSSASNSWKQINATVLPDIIHLPGYELFYNGTIHWIAIIDSNTVPFILCFDLSTETFQQTQFHDNFHPSEMDLRLMELNDRLAVVRYPHPMIEPRKTEIWVMTEYGVKESWTKQFVIGPNHVICPFSFLKNELLPVESDVDDQLAACALHENHFKGFQFYGTHSSISAVFYEESLISLNQIIASHH